jgi:uncharacterized protein (TIGR00255 family)
MANAANLPEPMSGLPAVNNTAPGRPIQSMTGYASVTCDGADGQVTVELRSVNSRFLDLAMRIPDEVRATEWPLRELIGQRIQRGKLECRVSLKSSVVRSDTSGIDPLSLAGFSAACAAIRTQLPEVGPPTIADALRWPGVLAERDPHEALAAPTLEAGRLALDALIEHRIREGERLVGFILERAQAIEAIVAKVSLAREDLLRQHEERLIERLRAALSATEMALPLEETMARVRQEVTLHGMRADVTEELDRLSAHLAELREACARPGPVGKRLDFLLQEFNREANTLGSKAALVNLNQAAIELKLLIEQIREQVQNLE